MPGMSPYAARPTRAAAVCLLAKACHDTSAMWLKVQVKHARWTTALFFLVIFNFHDQPMVLRIFCSNEIASVEAGQECKRQAGWCEGE
jgi:hypothetical protein